MEGNTLIQLFQGSAPFIEDVIPTITGILFTSLFLHRDSRTSEFQKAKVQHFDNLAKQLIEQGKMSHMEYFKWRNFKKIAELADKYLKQIEKSDEKERTYEFDWFVRFYEYSSTITNDGMQKLWGALLAGELNKPGMVSYSLLHTLYMMRKEDAQTYESICRFVLCDINNQPHPFIFITKNRSIYAQRNITPSTLKKLERFGLIECDFANEYTFQHEDKFARYNQTKVRKIFRTGNKQVSVYGDPTKANVIQAGNVVFTTDGEILYSILSESVKHYRGDILEFIVDRLRNRGCQVSINDRNV